jgi:hypothetical protein
MAAAGLSVAGASAGTMPIDAGLSTPADRSYVELAGAGVKYDRRRHGPRYKSRRGKHVHFHEGYWYATPWWTGVTVGIPGVVGVTVPLFGTPGWYTYCERKYKTFDRRSGKFRDRHGKWVRCY